MAFATRAHGAIDWRGARRERCNISVADAQPAGQPGCDGFQYRCLERCAGGNGAVRTASHRYRACGHGWRGPDVSGGLGARLAQWYRHLPADYYWDRHTRHAGCVQHLATAEGIIRNRADRRTVERRIAQWPDLGQNLAFCPTDYPYAGVRHAAGAPDAFTGNG